PEEKWALREVVSLTRETVADEKGRCNHHRPPKGSLLPGVGHLGEPLAATLLQLIGLGRERSLIAVAGVEHGLPVELVGEQHRAAEPRILGAEETPDVCIVERG